MRGTPCGRDDSDRDHDADAERDPGAPPEEEALGPLPRTLEKREGDELHGTGDSGGQENTGPPRAVEEP